MGNGGGILPPHNSHLAISNNGKLWGEMSSRYFDGTNTIELGVSSDGSTPGSDMDLANDHGKVSNPISLASVSSSVNQG